MEKIVNALQLIGKNPKLRNSFISFIKEVEKELEYQGKGSVRDDVTKYLVDALFQKDDFVIKEVQSGLKYKFLVGIGSKVGREFLLSTPETPEFAWEPQTTRILLHLAKNAINVIIGGAYFGDQALPIALEIKNNGGIVHGFDLNKAQIEILNENLALNNISNVKTILKGLWNNSTTFLNLSETDDLAFATPSDDKNLPNTITLDEYVAQEGLSSIDLIMLDIEGSEYYVLKGAERLLSRDTDYPNIVFEIHSSYVDWSKGLINTPIVQLLLSHGYHVFSFRDFQGNYDMQGKKIELIKPEETVIDGPPHGFNMVAVKDLDLLKGDLFKMVKNVSPKYIIHKEPSIHHHTDGF
ncbi:FkbM family methyltransferase [Aquirufa ecclesiirivi]